MPVAIVTQRPSSDYTSFQRTIGPESPSTGSSPKRSAPSHWNIDPSHHPPSSSDMMETTVHHKRNQMQQPPSSPGRLRFRLNPHQQQAHHLGQTRQQQKQQRPRPSYPASIQFSPSQDQEDHLPFDEEHFDTPLGLNRLSLNEVSLEDTFGFEKEMDSDLFERLCAGAAEVEEDEEDGTVELNPYSARDLEGRKDHVHHGKNNDSVIRTQEAVKIFRNQQNHPQPALITPTSGGPTESSPEKKINANASILSPTMAMDRRHSSRPKTRQGVVPSPSPSVFTSAASISRTNTGTSLHRNNTGASKSNSRSRHRSVSRSHRSRSRGTSTNPRGGHRSRSRSTSIAPSNKKDDEYHQSLFRGAALIREQLLRSMASADEQMNEAKREFMEDMDEMRGSRQQQLQAMRQARYNQMSKDEGDDEEGDIDFDYSVSNGQGDSTAASNEPSPSRGSLVKFAPSQDSSALETESRRLDNLMTAFAISSTNNDSMSSSNDGGLEVQRTTSDKENDLKARPNVSVNHHHNHQVSQVIGDHDIVSPTSSLGLTSPTSSQLMPSSQNARVCNEYASRYFQEDAPKPLVASPVVETTPNRANLSNARSSNDVRVQKHEPGHVDEALAHAQRAGPLWRSLVGNHVRFPSKWRDILPPTSPPIHSHNHQWSKWYYVARHRVKGDKRLNSREFGVRSRRSGGRILLRLVTREMHTQQICREVVVGCLHPNSKGIRTGDPLPEAEDVREIWMAVRWLMDLHADEPTPDLRSEGYNYEGVVDKFLLQKRQTLDYSVMGSALGYRKAVNNENVRAVFGDQPPMTTVDLHEDEIAEILKANCAKKLAVLPGLMLLKLFLFSN